jgi:ankyrin repeat protein
VPDISLPLFASPSSSPSECDALCLAAYFGRSRFIEPLVEELGFDISAAQTAAGHSAIHYACAGSSKNTVQTVIDAGGDADVLSEDGSSLHYACAIGNAPMIQAS